MGAVRERERERERETRLLAHELEMLGLLVEVDKELRVQSGRNPV